MQSWAKETKKINIKRLKQKYDDESKTEATDSEVFYFERLLLNTNKKEAMYKVKD